MEGNLEIYTDGSSAPNPRRGGAGARMIFPDGTYNDFGSYSYKNATNNQMELQACIIALKEVVRLDNLNGISGVVIFTDSSYIVDNYKNAMFNWPRSKWVRSNGEPILNMLQWKEIIRLMKRIGVAYRICVDFGKVKAHSGVEHNEAVDKLAKKSREGIISKSQISISKVRRKKTKTKTLRGSVIGEGQRLRIRVIDTTCLPHPQKGYRSRFEVISKKSKYFDMVDFVLSDRLLNAGHVYDVILMDGLDHCRIKKIIKEIE